MTEVYFLDRGFARCAGPFDAIRSLSVHERYRECGSFSLELPISASSDAAGAAYVEISGMKVLGLAEKIVCDEEHSLVRISGRTAEGLLSDRIVKRGTQVSGTLSAVIETVLKENAVDCGARAIPHLTIGSLAGLTDDDGQPIMAAAGGGGQALDEWLRGMLSLADASCRIVLNAAGDGLVFETYRGLDRTQGQETNGFAVFSSSFASIGDVTVTDDVSEYKNFAYVAGEGEGTARKTVEVDLREDPEEPLRELYVDARDLRSDDLSADAYLKALAARGRERLSAHPHVRRVEGLTAGYAAEDSAADGVLLPGSMRAGVDFALGDLCDIVCDRLGLTLSERVTELTTVWEGAAMICYARFGADYPDLRTRLARAERM